MVIHNENKRIIVKFKTIVYIHDNTYNKILNTKKKRIRTCLGTLKF